MLLRESFSGDSICSTHLLCQVHQFPNHGLFQKERGVDDAGGVIGGSDDGDKSVSVTSLS